MDVTATRTMFAIFIRHWTHQENLGYAIGYVLGAALIPAIIVLVYYKQRKKRPAQPEYLQSWQVGQ